MFLTLTIWDYKQFAKATGAHVTAISSSSSKRDDAAKLGADAYLDTSDEEAVKGCFQHSRPHHLHQLSGQHALQGGLPSFTPSSG